MMLGAQKNDDPTVTALLMLSLKKFIITDLNTYLSNEHCIAVDEIDDKHIVLFLFIWTLQVICSNRWYVDIYFVQIYLILPTTLVNILTY